MDSTRKKPSLMETINAVSDAQLHRYNSDTLELMDNSLKRWARELSTAVKRVKPYFIRLAIDAVQEPGERDFLNSIPTSFKLDDEQVDRLIAAGRKLLRDNPDYRRILASVGGAR